MPTILKSFSASLEWELLIKVMASSKTRESALGVKVFDEFINSSSRTGMMEGGKWESNA